MFGNREPEFARLVESDDMQPYMFPNWDRDAEIQKVSELADSLQLYESHIWQQPERVQMYCALTWLAYARQSTGQALVHNADGLLQRKGFLRNDVKNQALLQFEAARDILEMRDSVSSNPNYSFNNTLRSELPWPDGESVPVTKLLMHSLYETVQTLFLVHLPAMDPVWRRQRGETPPEFRRYQASLMQKYAGLDQDLTAIRRYWKASLTPETSLGVDTYKKLVGLLEGIVHFGVEAAMPVVADKNYRITNPDVVGAVTYDTLHRDLSALAVRSTLQTYDPKRAAERAMPEPKLPAYRPDAPQPKIAEYDPTNAEKEMPTPKLPQYDPSAPVEKAPQVPKLPMYDPSAQDAAETANKRKVSKLPEYGSTVRPKTLPEYNPSSTASSEATSPARKTSSLPEYNPNNDF